MIRRATESELVAALGDTPVVLVHGPRQCGKSTLAKLVGERFGAVYTTLDDPLVLAQAAEDPAAFLNKREGLLIVDEVQRAPGLFLALKASVDKDRRPGRFLLTGSANVLSLPKIADSLAGRMAIVDLLPLSQAEIEGTESTFIDSLFDRKAPPATQPSTSNDLFERAVKGGFPEPFLRASASRRDAWFADYVRSLLERDVRDLANIEGLIQMPRLLRLIAARAGEALNVVGLSRDTQIPNTSLHRYLELLQAVFLTYTVPAWSSDQGVRLTRTPKTYLVDSGLLCYLMNRTPGSLEGDPETALATLRNFVALELKKLCSVSARRPILHHLRTVKQLEVDFVLEARGGDVIGIQVRAGSTLRAQDADGLKYLRELCGPKFALGLVLYRGAEEVSLSRDILGAPFSALWS